MSLTFENMAVAVSGEDTDLSSSYYANSVSISESLGEINFGSLGSNSTNSVSAKAPEGSIDISFYITTGGEIDAITGHYGKTGFIEVNAGPFKAKKCLLNSFSFALEPLGMVMGSMAYTYYGQIESGSFDATSSSPTIRPAHGAKSDLTLDSMGVSGVLSISYDFSQSYDIGYTLGQSAPARVTFQEMTKNLSIDAQAQDIDFSKSSLTGASGICHAPIGEDGFSLKSGSISLKNLCNEGIAEFNLSGYLESRSFDGAPGENVAQSLAMVEISREGEC